MILLLLKSLQQFDCERLQNFAGREMGNDSEGEDSWSSHYKGPVLLGNCSKQTSVKREIGGEETGWKRLVVSAHSPKLGNNLCAHHLCFLPISQQLCHPLTKCVPIFC